MPWLLIVAYYDILSNIWCEKVRSIAIDTAPSNKD